MSVSGYNQVKITKNQARKTITLHIERRDSWNRVTDRFQITFSERKFDRALLEAQIIAPWNRVQS